MPRACHDPLGTCTIRIIWAADLGGRIIAVPDEQVIVADTQVNRGDVADWARKVFGPWCHCSPVSSPRTSQT